MHSKQQDALSARILSRVPNNVWSSLTIEQKRGIRTAIDSSENTHLFAVRSSIPMLSCQYYFAIFFGRERRHKARLQEEGQLDPAEVSFAYIILAGLVLIYGLIPLLLISYIIKSSLGIDLMDGPSPIHTLICN